MCKYGSRRAFDFEWELCRDINDVEVSYKEINYYQEWCMGENFWNNLISNNYYN